MEYRYRDASEMKDSGVEWIGKIPKNAKITKLKYNSNFINGYEFKSEDLKLESKVPVIRISDIRENGIEESKMLKVDEDLTRNLEMYRIKNNDILIAMSGATVGKIMYITKNNEALINQRVGIIRPLDINSKYLYYSVNNTKFRNEILLSSTGGAQENISSENIKNKYIIQFSNKEQENIVKFLDKKTSQFDSIISKKETLIEKLEEAKKSLISEVVTGKVKVVKTDDGYDLVKRSSDEVKDSGVEWLGEIPKDWENIKIKRLSRIGRGASPRPIDDPVYFDENGEYAWTRIADVSKSNKYLTETKQKMSERGSLLSVKLEINKLFLSIAGSVGKPCITGIKACIHDGFVYFPDLQEYLNDYLYYIFYGGQCYKGLGKLGTQLNLNRETVGDIRIGIPKDKEEVNYITSFLEQYLYQIDKLITSIELQIEKLKEAKQSLISEAVTGKIEILD